LFPQYPLGRSNSTIPLEARAAKALENPTRPEAVGRYLSNLLKRRPALSSSRRKPGTRAADVAGYSRLMGADEKPRTGA